MGTKCEPGTTSRRSSSDFSSDNDWDNEVPKPLDVYASITDATLPNLPLTQKRKRVSYYGVRRDKESLLEELLALREAFYDQRFHLKAHKEHHNAMEEENSRLGKKIEYLETSGLEAALTGTLTKLKSKLKGCKARIMDLETTCCANAAEEVTVQRELFALEVRRLQKCVFQLGNLCKKVSDDNKETTPLKEEIKTLSAKNPELETSVSLQRKSLDDMAVESEEWTAKGATAKKAFAKDYERFRNLQQESKAIMDILLKEKLAKAELTTDINTVSHQVRVAERHTREKERHAALGIE